MILYQLSHVCYLENPQAITKILKNEVPLGETELDALRLILLVKPS